MEESKVNKMVLDLLQNPEQMKTVTKHEKVTEYNPPVMSSNL